MAWDLEGNPLRRGHCEVHPHIAEMYPCSLCIALDREAGEGNQNAAGETVYVVTTKGGIVVGVRRTQRSADDLRKRWEHEEPESVPCTVEDHPLWD